MATMQERLLQKKMDKELPERVAEIELQDAKARFAEDKQDILTVEQWHISMIATRMVEWQTCALRSYEVCPLEGEVLFCDLKSKGEQDLAKILETKESLVKAWYERKQGLNSVSFRSNQRGTMLYMRFGFYSADADARVRSQCLKGRRHFEAHTNVCLYILRAKIGLPVHVVRIVDQFLPDYVEHVRQEKQRVENTPRW